MPYGILGGLEFVAGMKQFIPTAPYPLQKNKKLILVNQLVYRFELLRLFVIWSNTLNSLVGSF
ncbi:MAG: hypothetical protein A3J46_06555 [Candidatus Yanofskybacteria bacterium RIFCSPHIGHO2_02_FULL_41_11]|uniref:Uncharacterized protein n=1 Tax=Candidatus Yanofskybacteria bacterium RIFCSPHIGHO2_02_FULL_41_11 TaxID=1802675 RepID=A0A1F8F6C5_9BACT|nr:MAG: hypothetical protein A3J46_06555 [Candidatus Yanofskybacteria bacterium RIFCSPHIGHO2_02_FULL_41_11]